MDKQVFNPVQERIVNILNQKTGNMDKPYFRAVAAYTMGKVAAQMRTNIVMHDGQIIPVNVYALALGTSGLTL